MKIQSYGTTKFRSNLASAFNDVQADGLILLQGQGRPEMILTLKSEHDALKEKVRQLTELVKAQ